MSSTSRANYLTTFFRFALDDRLDRSYCLIMTTTNMITAEHYVEIARKAWENAKGRHAKAAAWRALRLAEDAMVRERGADPENIRGFARAAVEHPWSR